MAHLASRCEIFKKKQAQQESTEHELLLIALSQNQEIIVCETET